MAIRFDLSSIPQGVTIPDARLSLYAYQDAYPEVGAFLDILKFSGAWDEQQVTWYQADSLTPWLNEGGDYDIHPVSQTQINPLATNAWVEFQVASAVQAFISGTSVNHGLMVRQGLDTDELHFYSSEYSVDSLRPKLTISYTTDTNRITDTWKIPDMPKGEVFIAVKENDGISFSVKLPEGEGYRLVVYSVNGMKTWSYAGSGGNDKVFWSFPDGTVKSGIYLGVFARKDLKITKSIIIQP